MASLMVRVKCAVREVEIVNTGGRCGAIVLFCFVFGESLKSRSYVTKCG
jgi:hypothetical protein